MCWFNGAKAYISKAQIDEGLRNLEEAIDRYRLYVNNEWQLFADAIKQDKDFQTIINDERFKKLFI
jgi:hypothetical protein